MSDRINAKGLFWCPSSKNDLLLFPRTIRWVCLLIWLALTGLACEFMYSLNCWLLTLIPLAWPLVSTWPAFGISETVVSRSTNTSRCLCLYIYLICGVWSVRLHFCFKVKGDQSGLSWITWLRIYNVEHLYQVICVPMYFVQSRFNIIHPKQKKLMVEPKYKQIGFCCGSQCLQQVCSHV